MPASLRTLCAMVGLLIWGALTMSDFIRLALALLVRLGEAVLFIAALSATLVLGGTAIVYALQAAARPFRALGRRSKP